MKITTKIVWDVDFNVIEWEGFDYFGPVDLLKGGASKSEQAAADTQRSTENQLTQQQLDLQMKQLQLQQGQLNSVNAAVDPTIQQILGGNTPGVLQPLQSALTASYMNQLPNTYRNAVGNINQNLVARGLSGGQNAGGGGVGQDFGYMAAMLGQQQQAGAINAAETMSNANLGLLQNDLGLKLGVANQFGGMAGQYGANVGGFNQGALGALGQGVTAANNVDQAQTSWMGPVFGALGSIGGGLISPGGWLGKPGGGGGGGGGCWIAEACYGDWNDPRVTFIRSRLWHRAALSIKFKVLMAAYMLFGRNVARLVKRAPIVKKFFTNLFDKFILSERDFILNELVTNGR